MILFVALKETYFFFYEGIFPVSMLDYLKCSVSSTVTKFEQCHYIRCGDTAQYSKVSLSAVSVSDE
jgi:hypothetical protein